jgi:H/ACA ribonucleoprotein complex subunit 2
VVGHPLASNTKKAHKLIKKAASAKHIRRAVKEVVMGIRKGESGLAIIAGGCIQWMLYPISWCCWKRKKIGYLCAIQAIFLGAAAST